MNDNLSLTIFSVVLVALFGLISNILIIQINQKKDVNSKLIEQYLKIREDLCVILSDLINLKDINNVDFNNLSRLVEKLFYKHYDFIPKEVLDELLCLQVILQSEYGHLFRIINKKLVIIDNDDSEIKNYLEDISFVEAAKLFYYVQLKNADVESRKVLIINLQAKKVLYKMNDYFTLSNLLNWKRYLLK